MKRATLLVAVLAIVLAFAVVLHDYLTVDDCLDDGGRWSEETCQFADGNEL